jgi:hypothetical protein
LSRAAEAPNDRGADGADGDVRGGGDAGNEHDESSESNESDERGDANAAGGGEPPPAPAATFFFGAERHAVAPATCTRCVRDFPRPCPHAGCGGRMHGATVTVGHRRYVITQCERCLLPEPSRA